MDVRNALAVVMDVNERHNTDGARQLRLPFRRYHYRYSLFSMSGFTGPAAEFALAHQISLVDLQGPAFDSLRNIIGRTAGQLLELQARADVPTLPTGQIRTVLLALQPDDLHDFQQSLRDAAAVVGMDIRFARGGPVEGNWVVIPEEAPRGAMLRFGVPARLLEWLVSGDAVPADPAAEVKREFISSVVIFGHDGRSVELRLRRRQPGWLTRPATPTRTRYDALREELADPLLPAAPQRTPAPRREVAPRSWTVDAAQILLGRLDEEGWAAQVEVLRAAARTGSITRRQIFKVTGFPPERTLRGFLRPIERITADLINAGLLPQSVEPALSRTRHGRESTFIMPPDLVAILRRE
jgi:hypothetical protein